MVRLGYLNEWGCWRLLVNGSVEILHIQYKLRAEYSARMWHVEVTK